jgi:hypothetical protein
VPSADCTNDQHTRKADVPLCGFMRRTVRCCANEWCPTVCPRGEVGVGVSLYLMLYVVCESAAYTMTCPFESPMITCDCETVEQRRCNALKRFVCLFDAQTRTVNRFDSIRFDAIGTVEWNGFDCSAAAIGATGQPCARNIRRDRWRRHDTSWHSTYNIGSAERRQTSGAVGKHCARPPGRTAQTHASTHTTWLR